MNNRFIFAILISISIPVSIAAQTSIKTAIRNIPKFTELSIQEPFVVPAYKKSVVIDPGDGKICSCQFFTYAQSEERTFGQDKAYQIRHISIKGLFDGSQMHVARIYLENTQDYFKFKCYARNITIELLQDYVNIGENNIASEE